MALAAPAAMAKEHPVWHAIGKYSGVSWTWHHVGKPAYEWTDKNVLMPINAWGEKRQGLIAVGSACGNWGTNALLGVFGGRH